MGQAAASARHGLSSVTVLHQALYRCEREAFLPNPAAQGPWHPDHQNGAAFAGLLAHLAERQCGNGMMIAQLSIAILGPGLMEAMTASYRQIRTGSRLAISEVALVQHGRPFATAKVVSTRLAETPDYGVPATPRSPRSNTPWQPIAAGPMAACAEAYLLEEVPLAPGRGAAWARMTGDIVAGTPASALSQAAVLSDFASGLSAGVNKREWSYANVSLNLMLLRPPLPGWHLLEAESCSAGRGAAMTALALYDDAGLYGRSGQTLFIDRRSADR